MWGKDRGGDGNVVFAREDKRCWAVRSKDEVTRVRGSSGGVWRVEAVLVS